MGIESFSKEIDEEWQRLKSGPTELTQVEYDRVAAFFKGQVLEKSDNDAYTLALADDHEFAQWVRTNIHEHKHQNYSSVVISTKPGPTNPPGDMSSIQMRLVANLADDYGFSEIRVTHEQNLVLPEVQKNRLFDLWTILKTQQLASPTVGLLTDMITCPGGDYCSLANAKSIPIAAQIQKKFDDLDFLHNIGTLSLNISGCINACAHHHIANIGILGVDKKGTEWYQVTIGGKQGKDAQIGKVIGPSFTAEDIPDVIEKLTQVYLLHRELNEGFSETVNRIGLTPFKHHVYQIEETAA